LPLSWHLGRDIYRRHRARWLTRSTVNAGCGIYKHLRLIGATLNAVNRANINARQLFGANAGLTYHVGQTSRSALASFVQKIVGIHLSEMLPLLGQIVFREDRLHWAGWLARATVDAFVRMNI
jgi:hypothetical protein